MRRIGVDHSVFKTKQLRHLLRDLVRCFECLEELGFNVENMNEAL